MPQRKPLPIASAAGTQTNAISVYTVMTGAPERLRAGRFPAVKE